MSAPRARWGLLACAAFAAAWPAMAAEPAKNVTRVAIEVSGSRVQYTEQLQQSPPALILEFHSKNVKASLEPSVPVGTGIVQEILSEYGTGRSGRWLKRLTIRLKQTTAYAVTHQGNQILIDFDTPPGLLPSGRRLGAGITLVGIEGKDVLLKRLRVMDEALGSVVGPQRPAGASGFGGQGKLMPPGPVLEFRVVRPPATPAGPVLLVGLLLGLGMTAAGFGLWSLWRGQRSWIRRPELTNGMPSLLPGASVGERLLLSAMHRRGYALVSSKPMTDGCTLWMLQKDQRRQGVVLLNRTGLVGRRDLLRLVKAARLEGLRSSTFAALGSWSLLARVEAKRQRVSLKSGKRLLALIDMEFFDTSWLNENDRLGRQLMETQRELHRVTSEHQHLEEELQAHVAFRDRASEQLRGFQSKVERITSGWQQLEQTLKEEQGTRQMLEQELAELRTSVGAHETRQAQWIGEQQQLQTELTQARDTLSVKEQALAVCEHAVRGLEQQVQDVQTRFEAEHRERAALEPRCQSAETALSQEREAAAQRERQLAESGQRLMAQAQAVADLTRQLDEVRGALQAFEQRSGEELHIRQELEQRLQMMEQAAGSDRQQLADQLQQTQRALDDLRRRYAESEWYLGEEKAIHSRVREQMEELTSRCELLSKEREQLHKRWEESQYYLTEAQGRGDAAQAREQELGAAAERLNGQLAQLQEELAALRQHAEDRALAHQSAMEGLTAELASAKAEAAQLREDLAKASEEAATGESDADRRIWPRVQVNGRQKLKQVRLTGSDERPIFGTLTNISAGGACVDLPSGDYAGEVGLQLTLPRRKHPIGILASCVWQRPSDQEGRNRVGLAFRALDPADQELINQFVERELTN